MATSSFGTRRRRAACAASLLAAVLMPAAAVQAGDKINETTLYQAPEPSYAPNFLYGGDGSPVDPVTHKLMTNASCPHYPGVQRHGKVYVDTYAPPLHSQVRFALYTTYIRAVAEARVAIKQIQNREPSCSELYAYEPTVDAQGNLHYQGPLKALYDVACAPNAVGRPNRWCELQAYNRSVAGSTQLFAFLDPAADMNLQKCANPAYNGGTYRGSTTYTEVHNAGIPFANQDVFEGTFLSKIGLSYNDPVTIDDLQLAGGVSNWDPATDQPTTPNDRFIGYGRVQTPQWSEWNEAWYDAIASKIPGLKGLTTVVAGTTPYPVPYYAVFAHQYVQSYINNNTNLPGFGRVGDAYHAFQQAICNASPWVSDTLDGGGLVSMVGNGRSLVGWVDAIVQGSVPASQTPDFICYQLQHSTNPAFHANAAFGCQVWTFPFVLDYLWKHREGNPAGLPACVNPATDPIAQLLSVDFGCTNQSHFRTIFQLFRQELGG